MRKGLLFLLYSATTSVVGATPVPGLDLGGFVSNSDIIAVGTIATVEFERDTTIVLASGSTVPAREMRATLSADQLLKGSTSDRIFDIRFEHPESSIGYVGVRSGDFVVVFLKELETGYGFVSPYYPAITAFPGAQGRGSDAFSRVLNLLADGLQMSPQLSLTMATLFAIRGIDHPIAINALVAAANDPNPEVRLMAINSLLSIDQVDALPMAEVFLADTTPFKFSYNPFALDNLRGAIASSIRSEAAIPSLERLLQYPEVETRRAAAFALARIESQLIVEPLMRALDDGDVEVRYSAMWGLAKTLEQRRLVAPLELFRADEQRFIAPLRLRGAKALEAR
jgi:hypothetical protein